LNEAGTNESANTAAPSIRWMHYGLGLAGLGTALLGPILPLLARQWQMQDSQSGLLMTAKFCGAFLGGVTVMKDLHWSMILGMLAGAVGFGGFALAPGMAVGCVGLFVGGYGLGQLITSINILAGRRFTQRRGSALSQLNFSFSLGAMLSALLAAWLLPLFSLIHVLEGFAATFVVGLLWLLIRRRGDASETGPAEELVERVGAGLNRRTYLYFAGLLILYGGLETCLSGWLTTYALRYGDKTLAVSEYTTLLLWMSLTFGRVAAALILLRLRERTVQRWAMVLAVVFTVALAAAHSAWSIGACAVLLGLSLAPFFPATFALLMAEKPTARQAGIVLAVSGLGAAALPWLMGVISTRTGSLQVALVLPFGAAVALLALILLGRQRGADRRALRA
jgi:FHS family glucose/mannose:H+ symporter-like MFS transporter